MSAITLPFLRSANTLAGADTPPVNVENVLTFEKQTIPNTQSESIPDTYRIVFQTSQYGVAKEITWEYASSALMDTDYTNLLAATTTTLA